jgi:hypothetical protein
MSWDNFGIPPVPIISREFIDITGYNEGLAGLVGADEFNAIGWITLGC